MQVPDGAWRIQGILSLGLGLWLDKTPQRSGRGGERAGRGEAHPDFSDFLLVGSSVRLIGIDIPVLHQETGKCHASFPIHLFRT